MVGKMLYLRTDAGAEAAKQAAMQQQQALIEAGAQVVPADPAQKYHGAVAAGYEARRVGKPKWEAEQQIIETVLAQLPAGTVILDAPVGTGRFIPYYASKGFAVRGMDISEEMIVQAVEKVPAELKTAIIDGEQQFMFGIGDVRKSSIGDGAVDVAVNCRITRWLSLDDCRLMFKEMMRIARKMIIMTVRTGGGNARPVHEFNTLAAASARPWTLAEDHRCSEDDYRVLVFRDMA